MKKYVIGFMFNETLSRLVAIRKNRPEWQAGSLNGVGGHIEENELPIDAMVREFFEETGVKTPCDAWNRVLTLRFPYAEIEVFAAKSDVFENAARTCTDEEIVHVVFSSRTYYKMVENVPMLVALSKQRLTDREGVAPTDQTSDP